MSDVLAHPTNKTAGGSISVVGVNHATAPLAVREALACDENRARAVMRRCVDRFGGQAVLLGTCNRIELYHDGGVGGAEAAGLLDVLIDGRGVTLPADAAYRRVGREAVDHLFHVTAGLGSMILGESQILGQVRGGYELARSAGTLSGTGGLNVAFQRAVAAGREVLRETELGDGRASVGGVAVQYARQIFDDLDGRCVLMIGAGETGRLVVRSFRQLGSSRLLVANRTLGRAEKLAREVGGSAVRLSELPEALVEADVVVSSTGSGEPVVTRDMLAGLAKRRRYRPLFLIDLAVPRDIEPAAGELPDVYRYDLDDLQRVVSATLEKRGSAVSAARRIVARHVEAHLAGTRQRALGPTIAALYRRQHALAEAELERALSRMPSVTPEDRVTLQRAVRRIVNRLLHDPVTAMRDGSHREPNVYQHAVEQLFKLDEGDDVDSRVTA